MHRSHVNFQDGVQIWSRRSCVVRDLLYFRYLGLILWFKIWKTCNNMCNSLFCRAKMKGFPAWPGKVRRPRCSLKTGGMASQEREPSVVTSKPPCWSYGKHSRSLLYCTRWQKTTPQNSKYPIPLANILSTPLRSPPENNVKMTECCQHWPTEFQFLQTVN